MRSRNLPSIISYGTWTVLAAAIAPNMAVAKDASCIDYYTVGESKCQAAASTPVQRPMQPNPPQLLAPAKPDPVDEYLANYGKPPREFVEFYLNPTAENAQKWVSTYQGMLQKGQELSKAWTEAEELYKSSAAPRPSTAPQAVPQVPSTPALQPASTPQLAPQGVPVTSIGAFSQNASAPINGVQPAYQKPVQLTYYFSQICPYCARMTPELAILSNEKSGKLAFTCVDVTPVTAQSRPDQAFITSKLPCQWRLPEANEIDSESIRQTPTLVIRKGSEPPVRLSGYVPLAQLRQYF